MTEITDTDRFDWLSTATVGRELILGASKDGLLHWVTEHTRDGIDAQSEDGLRAAIDEAMKRESKGG